MIFRAAVDAIRRGLRKTAEAIGAGIGDRLGVTVLPDAERPRRGRRRA